MSEVGLSNALFSGVQQRVLVLIFSHPERSFYTSEIVRKVHSGMGAVERELSRLQSSGLVSVERIGNQKHYRANRQSPIFEELKSLILKTGGLAEPIKDVPSAVFQKNKDSFRVWFHRKRYRHCKERYRPHRYWRGFSLFGLVCSIAKS